MAYLVDDEEDQKPLIAPPDPWRQAITLPAVAPTNELGGTMGRANELGSSLPANQDAEPAPPTQLDTDKKELGRKISSGSGISQISSKIQGTDFGQRHPIASKILGGVTQGIATLGDVGLSAVAPSLAINLPGTAYHYRALVNQGSREVGNEEKNEETEAQTENLNLKPQLDLAKQGLAQEKQHETETHHTDQLNSQLAAHGFKTDETGNVVPLKYEEMSQQQQATHDLKAAQEEAADANAALKKAQNDPSSPAYRIAAARVAVARQNAQTALGRLGLSSEQFEMRAHGTQNGVPLAGSMIDDAGESVGTAFQQNVRPTGQERNKGDMANSAASQISDMKSIISKRPDIFGPAAGRTTDLQVWLGSQDPDAQRFRAARTIAGDHLAGTFGGRSEAALHALDNALGQFKDNPEAALAGLDQLASANALFQKAGTVKTTGSKAAPGKPAPKTEKLWNAVTGRYE